MPYFTLNINNQKLGTRGWRWLLTLLLDSTLNLNICNQIPSIDHALEYISRIHVEIKFKDIWRNTKAKATFWVSITPTNNACVWFSVWSPQLHLIKIVCRYININRWSQFNQCLYKELQRLFFSCPPLHDTFTFMICVYYYHATSDTIFEGCTVTIHPLILVVTQKCTTL